MTMPDPTQNPHAGPGPAPAPGAAAAPPAHPSPPAEQSPGPPASPVVAPPGAGVLPAAVVAPGAGAGVRHGAIAGPAGMPSGVPDAVLAPPHYAGVPNATNAAVKRAKEFGAILGIPPEAVRHRVQAGLGHFITADPHETLNFPSWHDYAMMPRYDWYDRGDGVKYGFKTKAAKEPLEKPDDTA
jgi:hypothetical protein